ncbi:hypothetical protein A3763_08085 [Oleiphilus sp. HI0128]|nr:hypothetical protein A3763_08085 [Oleiphilus sp. HI0128]
MVSIVTPMYNSREFIDETIQSVFDQTYSNWEMLLVDDCSKDGSFDYIREKYKGESRITVIQNQVNSGAGVSRNNALEISKGRYIAFLDSDDIWEKDKLKVQIEFMQEHSAPISHTSFSFMDEQGEDSRGAVDVSPLVDLPKHLSKTEMGMSTCMVDTKLVGTFRLSEVRARQDFLLWVSLLAKGHSSYGLSRYLTKYRIRKGQISANKLVVVPKTFLLYMRISHIPVPMRFIYFLRYVFNAFAKRSKVKR